jgi:hypothetical protein
MSIGQTVRLRLGGTRVRGRITKLHTNDASCVVGVSISTGHQTVWRAVRNGAIVEDS